MAEKQECLTRIARLQQQLQALELDGAIFAYPIDVYYYAGTRQNSLLWIPADGPPTLLVRKSFNRAQAEACVDDVRPHPSSREIPYFFAGARRIGLTYDVLPVQQVNFLAKLLPGKEFSDISRINRDLRSVKSPWEQEKLRAAGEKLSGVFAEIPEFLRPGMREIDLAAEFEYRARKAGNEGYVRMRAFNQELFQGIAVSGKAATRPGFFDGAVTGTGLSAASPHGASIREIEPEMPIMVDYTGVFDGYIVDMTRIFVFGAMPEQARHAFDTALSIQQEISSRLKPGENGAALFDLAQKGAEEAGLGEAFMGASGEQARFVGHGVGLELDEMPVLAKGFDLPLQNGQTIAVEPKFVLPDLGVVGIENTFLVTEKGGTPLTCLPDDLVIL